MHIFLKQSVQLKTRVYVPIFFFVLFKTFASRINSEHYFQLMPTYGNRDILNLDQLVKGKMCINLPLLKHLTITNTNTLK